MMFIADVMLGRLAKWLRIIGYDVIYSNRLTDREIIDIAINDNRHILTRDKGICSRHVVRDMCLYIKSSLFIDQVAEVVKFYHLDVFQNPFSRCIRCNHILHSSEDTNNKTRSETICPNCNRVYWRGSHVEEMTKLLKKISSLINIH
ncbi:MAG: DUF5615 family PIN-like protein [Thermodesulfovibrionales bacterium]